MSELSDFVQQVHEPYVAKLKARVEELETQMVYEQEQYKDQVVGSSMQIAELEAEQDKLKVVVDKLRNLIARTLTPIEGVIAVADATSKLAGDSIPTDERKASKASLAERHVLLAECREAVKAAKGKSCHTATN